MKIILEIHRYAPELNKVHIRPNNHTPFAVVPAPDCWTIKQVRERLFCRVKPGRLVRVVRHYDCGILPDQCIAGFGDYKDAQDACAMFVQRSAAGAVLWGGRIMPAPVITVKTWLVG